MGYTDTREPAVVYRDEMNRVVVLVQGDRRREFTPEEWRVICMAANQDMESRLHALNRATALRSERWEEERTNLLSRIEDVSKNR